MFRLCLDMYNKQLEYKIERRSYHVQYCDWFYVLHIHTKHNCKQCSLVLGNLIVSPPLLTMVYIKFFTALQLVKLVNEINIVVGKMHLFFFSLIHTSNVFQRLKITLNYVNQQPAKRRLRGDCASELTYVPLYLCPIL